MFHLIAFFMLLLTFASPVLASSCSSYPAGTWNHDQDSALRFEQTWLQVLKQKNTAALDCMLAPEFADTSRKGALRPREQVLRELSLRKEQDDYRQNLAELSAHLIGDAAVVHGVNVISDQQGHEILRLRFTDVLYYTQGHWLAVAAQETDEAKP